MRNSIILLSQLLSENTNDKLDKDQLDYAAVIHNSGHILLKLIEEILDLSKIESGDFHVVLASCDWRKFVAAHGSSVLLQFYRTCVDQAGGITFGNNCAALSKLSTRSNPRNSDLRAINAS